MLAIPPSKTFTAVMSQGKPILSRLSGVVWQRKLSSPAFLTAIVLASLLGASILASGKDALVAIALFDGPKGAAYVQITGPTLNGKTELRVCDGVPKIDEKAYDALPRIQLASAASLSRRAD